MFKKEFTVEVIPIKLEHAKGFHRSLDIVAREKKYLAQTEALPLEEIKSFVKHSVETDAPQFVVVDGDVVAGWADILPHRMPTLAHEVVWEWDFCRSIAAKDLVKNYLLPV